MDSEDFQLRPNEGVEMKYHMQKGAGMVYGWKANGKLTYEFHGEPDVKPNKDYFESYDLDDKVGKDASYGSFTAPSTGIHGWFFKNKTDKDVQVPLDRGRILRLRQDVRRRSAGRCSRRRREVISSRMRDLHPQN